MKKSAFIFLIALMLSGCTAQQLGASTNDPDARLSAVRMRELGNDKYMVSCVDADYYCSQLASSICGDYTLKSASGHADVWGNRRMIVIKCKD